jgi:hypothetical protein
MLSDLAQTSSVVNPFHQYRVPHAIPFHLRDPSRLAVHRARRLELLNQSPQAPSEPTVSAEHIRSSHRTTRARLRHRLPGRASGSSTSSNVPGNNKKRRGKIGK